MSELTPLLDSTLNSFSSEDDVTLVPGPNADHADEIARYISPEVRAKFDVYSYRHGAAILANSYPEELREIENALLNFSITQCDIGTPGGNESVIPRKFSEFLRPSGWAEAQIQGDLHVRMNLFNQSGSSKKGSKLKPQEPRIIERYIDGHKIDYVKGRVAFDLEWNSKDQTFDRDLYALRMFHECGLISAGIVVTRSVLLNKAFQEIPLLDKQGNVVYEEKGRRKGQIKSVISKYGASTTWMGKLLYRLNAGRHGGCPILVFGITPKSIVDYPN